MGDVEESVVLPKAGGNGGRGVDDAIDGRFVKGSFEDTNGAAGYFRNDRIWFGESKTVEATLTIPLTPT